MGDVGMVQRRQRLRFPGEPGEPVRVAGERIRQDFQRDIAIQLRIARPIHLAHAAFANEGSDFVGADAAAGL